MENLLDSFAELVGQDSDNIIGNRKELPGGGVKRNFLDNLFGRSQEELDAAMTKVKTKKYGDDYNALLGQYNALPVQPGETINSITSRLQIAKEDYEEDKFKRNQRLLYDSPQQIEDRRLAAEQRLDLLKQQEDNLAFQRLQAQRADDRYYDRLEREDARLRREGYQSLTSGLAALAAAFAIV